MSAPPPPAPPRPLPRAFRSVVLDCDSTLCAIEGIEELAHTHRAEVERLTDAAMRGEVPLEEVYARRLALIRPTRAEVDAVGARYAATLVPDAYETVTALRAEGVAVRIISGGLLPAVAAAARAVGLTASDVEAVAVRFEADGAYAGFDAASPLTRSGGKREVMERWRDTLPGPVMLVGDGATDLEARPAVDAFVAFAGVAERAAIVAAADAVVRARSLAPIFALALGDSSPEHPLRRALYEKGRDMLGT